MKLRGIDLKWARIRIGMSGTELARTLGVSSGTVSLLESGAWDRNLNKKYAVKLIGIFGSELFELQQNEKAKQLLLMILNNWDRYLELEPSMKRTHKTRTEFEYAIITTREFLKETV